MSKEYDFAVKKPCTPEQLKEETKGLYGKSELLDVGTFYFTYDEPISVDTDDEDDDGNDCTVFLKFYDEDNHILYTSPEGVIEGKTSDNVRITVLGLCTFFLDYHDRSEYLIMTDDWSKHESLDHREGRNALRNSAFEESHLSKIRKGTPGDFGLESTDGKKIMVHTAVLIPLWPFFASTLKSDKEAKTNKIMKFECSSVTLSMVVEFLYQGPFSWDRINATDLIDFAQKYEVPGMRGRMLDDINWYECTIDESLIVWKASLDHKDEKLRELVVSILQYDISNIGDHEKLFSKMSKEDVVMLLVDITKSLKESRSKKRKISSD